MSTQIRPRWLGRKGAVQYSGLSKTKLDVHIRRKDFVTKKVGKSRLIDRESLDAWINGREGAGAADSSVIEQIAADVRAIRELLERIAFAG